VVMASADSEIEVRLPDRYDISPAVVGSIKSLVGIVSVQPV
jgi:hypothetical protein